jgi:LmbE family N-acetylglucosaminyl deacetylase
MSARTLCSLPSEEFELDAVGTVLVIAPHPDDESIGCGGLIACLRRRGIKVWVMIATDGTGSHPNSPSVPTSQLLAIRRREALAALGILGVQRRCISFANMRDRFVPNRGPGFQGAIIKACSLLAKLSPGLLVIPSPSDQHGDHQALAAIWRHAATRAPNALRVVEYLVWPSATLIVKAHCLKLDTSSVRHLKRRAIAAHRSQRGLIVTDDPQGFILPPALLARANRQWEIYFEME